MDTAPAPPYVPATALSRYIDTFSPSLLKIGDNGVAPSFPTEATVYWFVVVDLSTLDVAAQAAVTSNSTVPPEIQPFTSKDGYFLFFIACNQSTKNVPQGDLHAFLRSTGAGAGLENLEQIVSQLGTGFVRNFSYIMAGTMDSGDLPGFEVLSTQNYVTLPMQFTPYTIDGKTMYAPSRFNTP